MKTYDVSCPFCGFLLRIIPVTQTDIVFVKCRKCKFDGALSPAYFRRIKRYQAYQSGLACMGREYVKRPFEMPILINDFYYRQ